MEQQITKAAEALQTMDEKTAKACAHLYNFKCRTFVDSVITRPAFVTGTPGLCSHKTIALFYLSVLGRQVVGR